MRRYDRFWHEIEQRKRQQHLAADWDRTREASDLFDGWPATDNRQREKQVHDALRPHPGEGGREIHPLH